MQYNHILIRFGELMTKGRNKRLFVTQLYSNIRASLIGFPGLTYKREYDRLFILLNGEDHIEVSALLRQVFGIHSFSLALKVDNDINAIREGALYMVQQETSKATFKVNARRSDKSFPVHSDDINREVGGIILRNTELKVNLHQPDMEVKIEVRTDGTFIMTSVIYGAGGFPVGIGGKALLLLSGGIDSPVAGYLTMKRGVQIECIHFASPPYTSPQARQKVLDLASQISKYQGQITVHLVPFTDLQLAIYNNVPQGYAITIMRRMMYRIAEKVAENNHCLALVSGESIGQVASQTLSSMMAINHVTTYPVIRPVITYDKQEIIELAKQIATYELSILPFEDCCTIFTPQKPATKPTLRHSELYEQFDYEQLLLDCLNNVETICLSPSQNSDVEDIF